MYYLQHRPQGYIADHCAHMWVSIHNGGSMVGYIWVLCVCRLAELGSTIYILSAARQGPLIPYLKYPDLDTLDFGLLTYWVWEDTLLFRSVFPLCETNHPRTLASVCLLGSVLWWYSSWPLCFCCAFSSFELLVLLYSNFHGFSPLCGLCFFCLQPLSVRR